MANRFHKFVVAAVAVLALSGCARDMSIGARNPQVAATPDKVSLMLAEAADKSANALQTLAAIEQARTPAVAVAPIVGAPPELSRAITVNWVGPVEPIAQTLADRASYGFQVVGTPPPVPIVVSVDVENKPVIEVMRSIGLQLGVRADVRVDSAARMVEIHYAPHTGAGG